MEWICYRNEGVFRKGFIIGLNNDDDTIALGILGDITGNAVTFRSPIQSLRKVNKIVFGGMTVDQAMSCGKIFDIY